MTDEVKECPFCVKGWRLPRYQQLLLKANDALMAKNKRPKYKLTPIRCDVCKEGKIAPDSYVTIDLSPGDPILSES